jgi:hypothetical protein
MKTDYPAHRYDDHLTLRVPPLLWFAMLYLVRHLVLLGITFLPTTGEEIEILRGLVHPAYLIADLIALPVLIAAARRRPETGPALRRIWRNGRWLLSLSALLYLVLVIARVTASGQSVWVSVDEALIASLLLDLAVLVYLWRSPLVRDLFRDFPEPGSADQPSPS